MMLLLDVSEMRKSKKNKTDLVISGRPSLRYLPVGTTALRAQALEGITPLLVPTRSSARRGYFRLLRK